MGERSPRLRAAKTGPAPCTGIFLASGPGANLGILNRAGEEPRRREKSAGPADLRAREDKGPKFRVNRPRGIWPFLGVTPKAPLIYGDCQAWLINLACKIKPQAG
jgi:hypothetical protein